MDIFKGLRPFFPERQLIANPRQSSDRKLAEKGLTVCVQSYPTLQTRVTGCGKSLSTSVLVAVVGIGGICFVLAFITRVHFDMSETQTHYDPVMVNHTKRVREQPQTEPNFAPERMITISNGPSLARSEAFILSKKQPEFIDVPEPELPVDELLVIEELDLESPFEEKTDLVKVKTNPTIAKKSPLAKRSGPTQAELLEREKARLAGEVTQQASVVSQSTPHYPRSARRKGFQGRVVVTVTVGTSGRVSSCQISQSSGHPSLDQSAVSAARRYRFFPAKNGLGQAISVRKDIPFNFQLTS